VSAVRLCREIIIASECIFNMDGSDLKGRTIKVSLAQQNQLSKLSSQNAKGQAIWSSDDWFQQHVIGDEDTKQKVDEAKQDKKTLKD
ncbi:MAG: RNA recognition motif-containing protein, partial [Bacillariaceae sp.]|jgi:RNA recognition motif-containing protein